MLNEVVIAEIREIFTLFDKNADGYVATQELGTIVRGLGHNPSEREVADQQREVDPNQTGSFDQNALISLIARRPKHNETLQEMIEALTALTDFSTQENDKPILKLDLESFRPLLTDRNKDIGENLLDHYVEEILNDSNLVNEK